MQSDQSEGNLEKELLLLYELSLSIGRSPNLNENIRSFLHVLQSKKNLDFSAVWIQGRLLHRGLAQPSYHRVFALPDEDQEDVLGENHPLVLNLASISPDAGFTLPDSSLPRLSNGIEGDFYVVFRLGTLGFLELGGSGRVDRIHNRELVQLKGVIGQFTSSLEACLAHESLLLEIENREKTQSEIERLTGFYEQVLDSMPAQLAVFDTEFRYEYITPSAISDPEMREYLIGKTDRDYFIKRGLDPAVGDKRADILRATAKLKKEISFEESFKTRNGELRHFLRRIAPVFDDRGEVVQLLGYGLDITDRKNAEENHRSSEALKAAILSSSLDAIITINQESEILEFNPAAESIFGYTKTEILGKKLTETIMPPAYKEAHNTGMDRYSATGEGPVLGTRIEIEAQRRNGEIFPIELAISPIEYEDGHHLFTAYVRDITQRKTSESDLIQAKELAQKSLKARERFLANMSHEMRTPLNAVIGLTHLLLQTAHDETQQHYLEAIKFSSDTLLALVNDVLDFAKMESGVIQFETVPFELEEIFRGIDQTLKFKAEDKGLDFRIHVDDRIPERLLGDPVRLYQILLNLANNGIKFTDQGSVSIRVLHAGEDEENVRLRIEIEDTGIGIAKEMQTEIFRSFTQASSDTNRKYGGTGLGLAIVQELVTRQGGTITVDSSPGNGALFTVELDFRIDYERLNPNVDDNFDTRTIQDIDFDGANVLIV